MALIKCPECGRENVSSMATACPDCGFPISDYFKNKNDKSDSLKAQSITSANESYNSKSPKSENKQLNNSMLEEETIDEEKRRQEEARKSMEAKIAKWHAEHDHEYARPAQSNTSSSSSISSSSIQKKNKPTIKCKYCGSTDVHKPYAKALRTALFGLKNPAYGKEWYCNKCGSYF